MNTTTTTASDVRRTFAASSEQLLALTDRVTPEHLHLATGSADFDVEALLGHLLAVFARVRHTLTTGSFEGSPFHLDSDDYPTTLATAATDTQAVLADEAIFAGEVTVPWGTSTRADAVLAWADELVVHAWDLALALDAVDTLDPALAEPALARYRLKLPPGPRPEFVPFDDEVTVPDDAGAYERLVAFTGRRPGR